MSLVELLKQEVNYMELVKTKVKKIQWWLLLSGYEDESELNDKYNYVDRPVKFINEYLSLV